VSRIPKELVEKHSPPEADDVYSYIVDSAKLNTTKTGFIQKGSGPNFQGDCITLCTCKHRMRAGLDRDHDQWPGKWIAGFTGRNVYKRCIAPNVYEKCNWLHYLMYVQEAFDSHFDLWTELSRHRADTLKEKTAHEHYLGDVYRPEGNLEGESRFDRNKYFIPAVGRHSHRKSVNDPDWHVDISCKGRYKRGNRPPTSDARRSCALAGRV
jgi:hypothetical protein